MTGAPPDPAAARPPRPPRVVVTGPRRRRARGYSARPGAADLHAQPGLARIYVRSLVRDQLRLSLGVLVVLTVLLGGLPAAFALVPGLRTAEVAGFPLAWLLLGAVVYPLMVGAAWFHVRHAERAERDFTDLLNGPAARTAPPAPGEPSAPAPAPPASRAPAPRTAASRAGTPRTAASRKGTARDRRRA